MSERASGYDKSGPPPRPSAGSMTTTKYYCRYHGRSENTNTPGACKTEEEVWSDYKAPDKNDPPCTWARILMFFGVKVKP